MGPLILLAVPILCSISKVRVGQSIEFVCFVVLVSMISIVIASTSSSALISHPAERFEPRNDRKDRNRDQKVIAHDFFANPRILPTDDRPHIFDALFQGWDRPTETKLGLGWSKVESETGTPSREPKKFERLMHEEPNTSTTSQQSVNSAYHR